MPENEYEPTVEELDARARIYINASDKLNRRGCNFGTTVEQGVVKLWIKTRNRPIRTVQKVFSVVQINDASNPDEFINTNIDEMLVELRSAQMPSSDNEATVVGIDSLVNTHDRNGEIIPERVRERIIEGIRDGIRMGELVFTEVSVPSSEALNEVGRRLMDFRQAMVIAGISYRDLSENMRLVRGFNDLIDGHEPREYCGCPSCVRARGN